MKFYEIFFSPTGGVQRVSGILAEALCENPAAIDVTVAARPQAFTADDVCLFAVPSFSGRVAATAAARIAQMQGNGARAILVGVYGNRAFEDTLIELKDIVSANGFRPVAAVAALAEHSIVRQFATGRPDAADEAQLREFAVQIKKKLEDSAVSDVTVPGNNPYKPGGRAAMRPAAGKKCIECGLCAVNCPVQAIDPKNPRTTNDDLCISCMRCIAVCPRKARSLDSAILDGIAQKIGAVCSVRKENELFL